LHPRKILKLTRKYYPRTPLDCTHAQHCTALKAALHRPAGLQAALHAVSVTEAWKPNPCVDQTLTDGPSLGLEGGAAPATGSRAAAVRPPHSLHPCSACYLSSWRRHGRLHPHRPHRQAGVAIPRQGVFCPSDRPHNCLLSFPLCAKDISYTFHITVTTHFKI
jgi:hypothetical protein